MADAGEPSESLALFLPARTRRASTLVFFHGGGWRSGDKAELYDFARRLSASGVVVVLPNYRLAPEHPFPAQIADVAAAVAWTRDRIAAWRADPGCLFLGGHSAGAHLAALFAVSPDLGGSRSDPAIALAGVVGVSGVYRIATQEGGATRTFIASVFGEDEELWHRASPIALLPPASDRRLPPFALLWTQGEHPLAVQESERFAAALRAAGQPLTTHALPGTDHRTGLDAVSADLLHSLSSRACSQ
jgi:arylformamidase